jgi:hypothetical protein
MTRKEFEQIRKTIEAEEFHSEGMDPFVFGIERARFDQCRYERLIEAAKNVESKTVRADVAKWKRQVLRAKASRERFQRLQLQSETDARLRVGRDEWEEGRRRVAGNAAGLENGRASLSVRLPGPPY